MKFSSISDSKKYFNRKLDKEGKEVYISRLDRKTKELIDVSFKIKFPVEIKEKYRENSIASREIVDTFNRAYNIFSKDLSARYATGMSEALGDRNPTCLISIQILLRDEPFIISYFRSMNIENKFVKDIGEIAGLGQEKFDKGTLKFLIGSLHKYV